jgi:pyrroline-5-carboxylate reductase
MKYIAYSQLGKSTQRSRYTWLMNPSSLPTSIAFVGGGNMASAIIGGLLRRGLLASQCIVIEPFEAQRNKLRDELGVQALAQADASLSGAQTVVWAVKPQSFSAAASAVSAYTKEALHLSVMAGITSGSMAQRLMAERIVRSMPNTPALIGQGITGLYARAAVSEADKLGVEALISTTGEHLWVAQEAHLDAVTALSGSGPAYVFYFIEAMMRAGQEMGLPEAQARQLAQSTFAGAASLSRQSSERPETLRERVTSKGGTTYAAITAMQAHQIGPHFEQALHAACHRARELGEEFGRT